MQQLLFRKGQLKINTHLYGKKIRRETGRKREGGERDEWIDRHLVKEKEREKERERWGREIA